MSASQILHRIIGGSSPECIDAAGDCYVCGGPITRAMRRDRWMGANFTQQDRVSVPQSEWVCESCVIVMAGRPPDTQRMYSHLVDGPHWWRGNKADKTHMRTWLREPKRGPWFAAVADSGQKHLIPWSPINHPGASGRVNFEGRVVTIGRWDLVDEMAELLTMGATKEEMRTGAYGPRAWAICGPALRAFIARPERDSGWFALALWLAQRDEARVAERIAKEKEDDAQRRKQRAAAKPHRGGAARAASGVFPNVACERADPLGSAPVENAERGEDQQQPGGVADRHVASAPARGAQCELFGPGPSARGRRAGANGRT